MKALVLVILAAFLVLVSVPAQAQTYTSQQIDNFNHTFQTLIAYDASDRVEYVGRGPANAQQSAAVWQIKKLTYNANDDVVSVKFADGSGRYDFAWSLRATYDY